MIAGGKKLVENVKIKKNQKRFIRIKVLEDRKASVKSRRNEF